MKMRHLAKSRLKNDDDGFHADGCSRRARPPGKPISRRAMSRGEREMDARESASERDDAEMSDSDEETPAATTACAARICTRSWPDEGGDRLGDQEGVPQGGASAAPRQEPSPDAAGKFQTLQKVYGVLGDAEKRKVYDETGRVDDAELSGEKFNSLYEYYRAHHRKVTEEDIDDFFRTYRGGDEESKDIVDAYVKFEGDMSKVFMWVMCSDEATDASIRRVVDDAVQRRRPRVPEFERWAKKTRERPAPKRPLESREKKKNVEEGRGGRGRSRGAHLGETRRWRGEGGGSSRRRGQYGARRRARPRRRAGGEEDEEKTKK